MSMSKLDANQIIRLVYDPDAESLKMMPGAPIEVDVTVDLELDADDGDSVQTRPVVVGPTLLWDEIDAADDATSDSIDALNYGTVCIVFSWVDLDDTDATIQVQGSLDDVIFFAEGSPIALSTPAGSSIVKIQANPYAFINAVYTSGGNALGTVTAQYVLKG